MRYDYESKNFHNQLIIVQYGIKNTLYQFRFSFDLMCLKLNLDAEFFHTTINKLVKEKLTNADNLPIPGTDFYKCMSTLFTDNSMISFNSK